MSDTEKRKLSHGIKLESAARDKYYDVMKFKLNRNIILRETGMMIPPQVYLFEASPDGLVYDAQSSIKFGVLEIKCPEGKKNHTFDEAMEDKSLYIELHDGKPALKKDHHFGCCTQIQVAMGFCGVFF